VEIEIKAKPVLLNTFIFQTPYLEAPGPGGRKKIDGKLFWQEITSRISPAHLKNHTISVSLPNISTMTIYLLLPKMGRSELAAVAINEARRKMIPASGPEHVFEWMYLGDKTVSNIVKSEVLVVRAEKQFINEIIDLFKAEQLTPEFISPLYCALPATLPKDSWKKDLDVTFVDFGEECLSISVCKEGKVALVRNVGYGIRDIIQDFVRQTGNSEGVVRNVIELEGIPKVDFDLTDKVAVAEEIMRQKYEISGNYSTEKPKILPLELTMLWQTHVERVVHEMRRSFVYYKDQSAGRRVEYIYFLGGASQIKNFVTTVSSSIRGDSKVIDTIAGDPAFASAASLALINYSELKINEFINFLPLEIKKQKTVGLRRFIILASAIGLLIFLGIALVNLFFMNKLSTASVKKLDAELSKVSAIVSDLRNLSAKESKVRALSGQIDDVLRKRHNFYPILVGLVKAIPKEIVLTRINLGQGTAKAGSGLPAGMMQDEPNSSEEQTVYSMQLAAEIFADYEEAKAKIEAFQKTLSSLPYFSNITATPLRLEKIIPSVRSGQKDGLRLTTEQLRKFTLTLQLKLDEQK